MTQSQLPTPRAPGDAGAPDDLDPVDPGPPPADPPRDVTDRVRRASWSEPRVRFWLLVTLVLLAVDLYLLVSQHLGSRRDAALFATGREVPARIIAVESDTVRGHQYPAGGRVRLQYEVDGKAFEVFAVPRGFTDVVKIGELMALRVDPADPTVWTARPRPPSLLEQTLAALTLAPAVAAAGELMCTRRDSGLLTCRPGEALAAVVLDAKHVAVAPRSRAVRCTPAEAGDPQ